MIYYNWKRIVRVSKAKVAKVIAIIEAMLPSDYIKSSAAKHYEKRKKDFIGTSYLLNPEPLIRYANLWGYRYVAQYIGLASLRNLMDYRMYGHKFLYLEHSPLSLDILQQNKLLTIKDNKIYFYYEER